MCVGGGVARGRVGEGGRVEGGDEGGVEGGWTGKRRPRRSFGNLLGVVLLGRSVQSTCRQTYSVLVLPSALLPVVATRTRAQHARIHSSRGRWPFGKGL